MRRVWAVQPPGGVFEKRKEKKETQTFNSHGKPFVGARISVVIPLRKLSSHSSHNILYGKPHLHEQKSWKLKKYKKKFIERLSQTANPLQIGAHCTVL